MRVNHQPTFILSSTPWRENSLRLEVFSRDYGRVSLLARSARTRGSELRGLLVPFVPISISWFGKEELKTLHRAEWLGGWAQPKNRQLLSSLYLNELLLKMTAREDATPALYEAFSQAMQQLSEGRTANIVLRHFEWQLLSLLGFAPDVQQDSAGQQVVRDGFYWVAPEIAVQKVDADLMSPLGITVSGSLLQDLAQQQLNLQSDLNHALRLTRLLIDHYLPNGLASRQVLQQLQDMKRRVFE